MNSEQLADILKAAFPEAEVAVSGQGGKFDLRIVDDQFEGKRLNSPNDVVVHSDGGIWFTDPTYGILSDYEGYQAEPE